MLTRTCTLFARPARLRRRRCCLRADRPRRRASRACRSTARGRPTSRGPGTAPRATSSPGTRSTLARRGPEFRRSSSSSATGHARSRAPGRRPTTGRRLPGWSSPARLRTAPTGRCSAGRAGRQIRGRTAEWELRLLALVRPAAGAQDLDGLGLPPLRPSLRPLHLSGEPVHGFRVTPQGSPLDDYGRNVFQVTQDSGTERVGAGRQASPRNARTAPSATASTRTAPGRRGRGRSTERP